MRGTAGAQKYFDYPEDEEEDVTFELVEIERVMIGQPFHVDVSVTVRQVTSLHGTSGDVTAWHVSRHGVLGVIFFSCAFPFTGGLLLLLQGYRCCAEAHPTPGYHIWGAYSEDRETPGIEPGTSRSPDERSPNCAKAGEHSCYERGNSRWRGEERKRRIHTA